MALGLQLVPARRGHFLTIHDEWETIHKERPWGKWPRTELDIFLTAYQNAKGNGNYKFLDIGCGNGASMLLLKSLGMDAYGIDISESAIKRTRVFLEGCNLPTDNLVVGDIKQMPYEDNYFDCVVDICSTQCNPIEDLPLLFKEIQRVTKPGGYFFCMFRSDASWLEPHSPFTTRLSDLELTTLLLPYFAVESREVTVQSRANLMVSIIHHLITAKKGGVNGF